ncbi:hypothetical protein [Clostridium estertheticum]|uniref:hypothetical protein n=1 Tax=Clostridium estertheticum TaxID=238834 RepID=UPI001C6E3767|nr:hypothetical protein [Clostridium estertheticum]MBW9154801.1 hypothetical protein [Clostridium estertheticum]WLC82515.1 hypothetical protein KTC97_10145 [Clostridium estertheticum]
MRKNSCVSLLNINVVDKSKSTVIFNGIVQNIRITNINENHYFTSTSLYFPSETSEDPIVTGCIRTNGSSCAKTADTTKRYFGTEHGSKIEMVPDALNVKGGSKEPLSISFDDAVGVTIKSHKKLSLNAAGGIIMKTPQSVKLKAQSQILVSKAGTKSGFSMETDLYFLSNNVIKNGSDREAFAAFDDEPTAGKKPEPKPVKKAVVVKTKKKETKKEEKKKDLIGVN